ncbi:MAG: tRNA pseudouridine(55) synthase TruB [Solobacterium sp.]|nr:tRNA pseudouridine(55) synthase TruB [Solobacterium sp.]
MDGILLINKEAGMTSFDVVRQCRNFYHEKKIGHTGTLDPNATGLLLVLMGKYTKFIPYCAKDEKHYIGRFQLGISTDTEDIWGNVMERKETKAHTQEELDEIAASFIGKRTQIPPMYSALKVDGKRLYELARKGVEVERKEREIEISSLSVKPIGLNEYEIDAIVSSGTYIRTLIQDFVRKLGEIGTMSALERIGIEHLSITQSITLNELSMDALNNWQPLDVISKRYPLIEYEDLFTIKNGRKIKLDIDDAVVILKNKDMLIAAYERREDGYYHCLRGLF